MSQLPYCCAKCGKSIGLFNKSNGRITVPAYQINKGYVQVLRCGGKVNNVFIPTGTVGLYCEECLEDALKSMVGT